MGAGSDQLADTICIGDIAEVHTQEEMAARVLASWRALVPPQAPTEQPTPHGIVNLPVIFDSGQPRLMAPVSVPVYRFAVTVTAVGEWTWTFAPDAGPRTFAIPGSRYPDFTVSHTYTRKGEHPVALHTDWWGSYTVTENGRVHGPFPIDSPATQDTRFTVPVVELVNLLVTSDGDGARGR